MEVESSELYGVRLLVFMETDPQTNKYRQVILSPEQFKRMSLSLGEIVSKNGDDEEVELKLSDEEYGLPDLEQHE